MTIMSLVTKKLCNFITPSFYLHSPLSTKNPISFMTLTNPSYLRSPPLLLYSTFQSSPVLRCRNDESKPESMDEKVWEKWMKHFDENDRQAKLLSHLKSQYTCAVDKEDYENAVRLQMDITEATQNDAVGRVMSKLNKAIKEERYEDSTLLRDHTSAGLVGWWAGVSHDRKDPYGQIVHISPEHGRFVAKSYSPWQLATAKDGTPIFEIYVSSNKEGNYKEQAIYLKHKGAPEGSLAYDGIGQELNLSLMTPYHSVDLWAETLRRYSVALGKDDRIETFRDMLVISGMDKIFEGREAAEVTEVLGVEKSLIRHTFAVGGIVEKVNGKLENDFLRVPATLERKGCFSFSLSVHENKDQQVSGDYSLEDNYTLDHDIFDHVDCAGRGIFKKKRCRDKLWSFALSRAQNQQPLLSGLTTFNQIDVPASSDPLNGLYIGSNGYLVTEVIQIKRKFGQWPGDGGVDDLSMLEPCEYVEALNLTGDPDVPAGQVAFRAKVGGKYKLPPWNVLETNYGAVARYKGEGRLTGFKNSTWVDAEIFIIGEERPEEGFAIGFLYPTAEYYFLRLFKKLGLQSSGGSH